MVVTWKVMPRDWTSGQPAAIDEGYWGGSWAGQDKADSDAGVARITGEERKTKVGCGPGGLSPHWVPAQQR